MAGPVVQAQIRWAANTDELKRNIADGVSVVDAMKSSVDRTVQSLSGNGLFQAANKVTAAISEMGGVTKLTAAEQERATAILDKAIEKYKVMGVDVPPLMQQVRDSIKQIEPATDSLKSKLDALFNDPVGAAKSYASTIVSEIGSAMGSVGIAVGAAVTVIALASASLMTLGSDAEVIGAKIGRMGTQFDIPVQNVSNLRFAVTAAGGDFDTFGDSMFTFQKRIEENGDVVGKGLSKIGLSLETVKSMRPDEQFLAISDAVRGAGSEVNKSAVAFEIFGKQGKDILPLLMKPLSDLNEESEKLGATWNDRDVAAARAFRGEVTKLAAETDEAWTTLGRTVAPITNDVTLGWDRMKLAVARVVVAVATSGDTLLNAIGISKDWALASETAAAKQDTINKAVQDGAPTTIKYGEAVRFLNDQYESQKPAVDKASDAAQAWLKKLGDGILAASKAADQQRLLTEGLAAQGVVQGEITDFQGQVQAAYEKSATAQAKYKAEITGTVHADADQVAVLKDLIPGLVRGEATYDRVRDAIGAMVAKGEQVPEFLKNWYERNRLVLTATQDLSGYLVELTSRESDAADSMYNLAASQNEFHDGITIAGDTISTVSIPLFSTLATGVVPQMTGAIKDATKETASFADELSGSLDEALTSMPNLLVKAFTGGGGLSGATSALGSKFGADMGKSILGGENGGGVGDFLTDHFGDAVGGALGAAIPAVGALIGPLIGKLFSIGGPSEAELAGRKTEAAFEQGLGGIAGIGKALTDTGMSADAANAHIQALFAAEKSGGAAVQTQIDAINAIISQHAAQVSTGVGGILDAAKTVGTEFPTAMQPVVAQLAALPGLTDAEKTSLLGLANAGEPSFTDLSAAAGRYGLTLDTLGGKAGQLSISHEADQIESDYDALVTKSGADSDKVLAGMKTSLTTLVDHALDAGAVLPTALQPLVKQLFDTGQLTDTAGHKITDLSKLKFDDTGDPLAKGMTTLTDAINNLGLILQGLPATAQHAADGMGAALAGVKTPTIHVPVVFDRSGDDPSNYAAMGGLVTNHGITQYFAAGGNVLPFSPRGSDTVPAMLTPGESVLTRQATAELGTGTISALNRGGRLTNAAAAPVIDIAPLQALHAEVRRLRSDMAAQAALQPSRLARAVRDAIMAASA